MLKNNNEDINNEQMAAQPAAKSKPVKNVKPRNTSCWKIWKENMTLNSYKGAWSNIYICNTHHNETALL